MSRATIILYAILLLIAVSLTSYLRGMDVGRSQERVRSAEAREKHESEQRALQARIDLVSAAIQAIEYGRQSSVREIYRESQSIVERPVYRNVCIDGDGVGLLDRAAAAGNGESVAGAAGVAAAAAESAAQ